MKRSALIVSMVMLASTAWAQGTSRSYWLLSEGPAHTWCGYTDPSAFQGAVAKWNPTEVAIVTYSLGKLTRLTHEVESDSGGWSVVDQYTPSSGGLLLQRHDTFKQQNLQIDQTTMIRGGQAAPLRLDSVTTLQGEKTAAAPPASLPTVPVFSDVYATPPMLIVTEMRHESVPVLCRKSR